MFSVSHKMYTLSLEYKLRRQNQSFESKVLNQALAPTGKRTSDMLIEEQAEFAHSTKIPPEFLYKPPETSHWRPFNPHIGTSNHSSISMVVGPRPETTASLNGHHSFKPDLSLQQQAPKPVAGSFTAPAAHSTEQTGFFATNTPTAHNKHLDTGALSGQMTGGPSLAPVQTSGLNVRPPHTSVEQSWTPAEEVVHREAGSTNTAGCIVDENHGKDRSSIYEESTIGNRTYAAIRSEFEDLIVDRPPEIAQNHLALSKYDNFKRQSEKFFIQFHLQNAIMDAKEEVLLSLRRNSNSLDPMVIEKIQSCYSARLRESELGSTMMELQVTPELITRQTVLMSKLGWHPSGFFELLDKHFPN